MILCTLLFSCQFTKKKEVVKKQLIMNSLFSDNMVLQQQEEVAFWGTYSPGQKVSVSTSWGKENNVIADEQGKWSQKLSTPKAGGPYEISIITNDSTILFKNVLIGEVWIAAGQSNMAMPLTGFLPYEPVANYQEEIANAKYPTIRMFTVEKNTSPSKLDRVKGDWQVCFPTTADKFSATGYFFARKLQQELAIPIGIIHTAWGGTEAEAWTSKEGLKDFPEFIKEIEAFDVIKITNWTNQFASKPKPNSLEELEQFDLQDEQISNPQFDDSKWAVIDLPHEGCLSKDFIPATNTDQFLNGAFWYRKTVQIEDMDSEYQLHIGSIDDGDVTYINGHKIGATLNWSEKRKYSIPKSLLQKGKNTVAIKQLDTGGGSAISGPIYLENKRGDKISLEGAWSGLFYGDLSSQDLIIYGLDHQDKLKDKPLVINSGPNDLSSSLFNGMLNPLIPYTIKGAIWYQGESNVGRAEQYEKLFPAMIKDWRAHWQKEFPFYFVQIAPFSYRGDSENKSADLRDAQRKTLTLSKTGMASTMDIGKSKSLHPDNKQDVGIRLALLALDKDYGVNVVSSGPLYKSHTIIKNKILLEFDHIGSGLMAKNAQLESFEIAGADKQFVAATAKIVEDKIEVVATTIDQPVYARYAWKDFIVGSLFNKEGLPASSFTTE